MTTFINQKSDKTCRYEKIQRFWWSMSCFFQRKCSRTKKTMGLKMTYSHHWPL